MPPDSRLTTPAYTGRDREENTEIAELLVVPERFSFGPWGPRGYRD